MMKRFDESEKQSVQTADGSLSNNSDSDISEAKNSESRKYREDIVERGARGQSHVFARVVHGYFVNTMMKRFDESEKQSVQTADGSLSNNSDSDISETKNNEVIQERPEILSKARQKKKKRGIIYLSTIPKFMNVTKIREVLGTYGKLGRVYLQLADTDTDPAKKKKKKRKVASKHFTEGWVEFESKTVAKYVAATLNNKQVSTQKKSKFYDLIWNIKYLPRFKWIHLSERLAYERAVHKQRLNAEIAQAKREVNFFSHNIDRSKKLRKKEQQGESSNFVAPDIKQRDTDMEIRSRKNQNQTDDRTEFLKSLFA